MFKTLKQLMQRGKPAEVASDIAAEPLVAQVPNIAPAEVASSEPPAEPAYSGGAEPNIIRFSRPQHTAAEASSAEANRRADSCEQHEADSQPSIPMTKGSSHTWLAMSGLPDADRSDTGAEQVQFEEARLDLDLNPRVLAVCRKVADRLWDRACAASPNVVLLSPVSWREESFPWAACVGAALAEPGSEVLCIEPAAALPGSAVCELALQTPLSELLINVGPDAAAGVERAGRATTYEHLSVLTSQQLEDCTAHEAAEIWRWLGERFRWVVVNAGHGNRPLARRLARSSNLAVLCLTLGRTRRRRALDAIQTLERSGARVVGCVAISRG